MDGRSGRGLALACLVVLMAALVAGCLEGPTPSTPVALPPSGPGVADPFLYGETGPILVFSFVGANVLEVTRTRGPILEYLGRRLGMRFRLDYRRQYDEIIDAMVGGTADLAWLGPKTYLTVRQKVPCVAVAQLLRDGVGYYEGVILVRRDSRIHVPADLRGKRLGLIDRESTSGYIYPLWWFRRQGLDPEHDFASVDFAGSHSNALIRLVNGTYDAVATERDILVRSEGKLDLSGVDVLAVTGRIPNGPIAARASLEPDVLKRIGSALRSMRRYPEGRSLLDELEATSNFSGFGPVTDDVYDGVKDIFLPGESP